MGAIADALDQLSPEIYLDTEIAALFSSLAFTNSLMTCPVRDGAAAFIQEGECVWARLSGRDFDQESTFQTLGFDETSLQVAAGGQFALGPVWRIGGALGYEHPSLKTDTNAKSEGDRFNGGVVVKYNPGPLLLAAGVSGSLGSYDTDRPIAFPGFQARAKGDNDRGWFIGASGGNGSLIFHGLRYPLSIGGLSVGLVARAIVLRNEKGAVLTLSGRQVGLIANADLSGLAISLR